jgi:hypothetical protein
MADTLKPYAVQCPDPDCAEEFTIERAPEALLDDGEMISCPVCQEEWEWEFEAGVITLLLPEDDDEEDDEIDAEFENDDEDDEA